MLVTMPPAKAPTQDTTRTTHKHNNDDYRNASDSVSCQGRNQKISLQSVASKVGQSGGGAVSLHLESCHHPNISLRKMLAK